MGLRQGAVSRTGSPNTVQPASQQDSVVSKSASLEHNPAGSPGQQKLPRPASLHNSPAGGVQQSPVSLSKDSPGQNVQDSTQLTPTTSNTVNLLSVSNSNTSEPGFAKLEAVRSAGNAAGASKPGSSSTGNPQARNSNFGLNYLKGFANDEDDNAFHEIEGSEDDEEGTRISVNACNCELCREQR